MDKKSDSYPRSNRWKAPQMKEIAVYAAKHDLPDYEINELNTRINRLKQEVHMLERQRRGTVH